ncbi:hypothetical protein [Mycobacterium sp. UM_Kg1]|uniref:hypothetical protein n=1 Tax=Mycobacterium sp. UM_Kg1 TaxID=1545691 RepID=UPI00061B090B
MSDRHQPAAGATPAPQPPTGSPSRIIRRAPTGAFPIVTGAQPIPPVAPPGPAPLSTRYPSSAAAIGACVLALLSCWATSVVSTDLIASWWQTDRLFCVAVGFLTLVFGGTTVSGVIMLLLRRPLGRLLITVGMVVALLTFGSLFLAGARVPAIVHVIPVFQLATIAAALQPATRRWLFGI